MPPGDSTSRIAEEFLHHLRKQQSGSEQHDAQHEHGAGGDKETTALQKPELDDGMLVIPFPDGGRDNADHRNHCIGHDERGTEPVVTLAFVEHDLKCA
jgi:hypothetical protein